jgi:hypothetical protein
MKTGTKAIRTTLTSAGTILKRILSPAGILTSSAKKNATAAAKITSRAAAPRSAPATAPTGAVGSPGNIASVITAAATLAVSPGKSLRTSARVRRTT